MAAVEDELFYRGFDKIWALVDSQEKFRWCVFLGFNTANLVIHDTIEVMVKDI